MKVRKATPQPQWWGVAEIQNHLKCDEMKAKTILDGYHAEHGGGYGQVEKALILDYIETKQRQEREREARYQSDLANVESIAVLKEQIRVLRESTASSSKEAQSAKYWALFASILSVVATIAAAFIPWLLNRP